MNERITASGLSTIGLDLGDQHSEACAVMVGANRTPTPPCEPVFLG
jgi:hypothetical protein